MSGITVSRDKFFACLQANRPCHTLLPVHLVAPAGLLMLCYFGHHNQGLGDYFHFSLQ